LTVRWTEPGESIGACRGDVVVCIPVYDGHELLVRCLRSVLTHTPASVPIMICDDASPDNRSEQFVRRLGDGGGAGAQQLFYVRRDRNVGFPANVNGAFAAAAPADVVVLNSDCVVAEAWLEGLRGAAYASGTVATATALTNHGSIASVPDLRHPRPALPDGWELDDAAAVIRLRSRRVRPRIPTAIGHCMFIRRTALELVGDFDLTFTPGYGEEVDFSQRCRLNGLHHVLADDVLVLHQGGGSFGEDGHRHRVQAAHEQIIATRYPHYHDGLRSLERTDGPLSLALNVARRALTGLAVTVDLGGTSDLDRFGPGLLLELLRTLAQTHGIRLAVVLPDSLRRETRAVLAGLPGVRLLTGEEAQRPAPRADVVHRMTSIRGIEDMRRLRTLGERVVITAEDLWRYDNPTDFSDFPAWDRHRALTRDGMALADRVVFSSDRDRLDALAEGLVADARASTVHPGVERRLTHSRHPEPPRGAEHFLGQTETVLCIGSQHGHASGDFALRLVEQLQRSHHWAGRLVLVGPERVDGAPVPPVAPLATRAQAIDATFFVPALSRSETEWLLRRCRLVLDTAIAEASASIAFAAAERGVPAMWAPGTLLSELIPDHPATIVPWDAGQCAERAFALLREDRVREENVAAVRSAASRLTWEASAERLIEVYEDTCAAPEVSAARLMSLETPALEAMGEVAGHPRIRTPAARALELGYRATFRLQRWRSAHQRGER